MTILQLNPSVPLDTPLGKGHAILVIDYGEDHHLIWTVVIDETGEIWSFPNPRVRAQQNMTMERRSCFKEIQKTVRFPSVPLCNT